MNKLKVGDKVTIIITGAVGRIIRIGDDQYKRRGSVYKVSGYEEMWFRSEELLKEK